MDLQSIKILVVDDDQALCEMMETVLLRAGAEVSTAMRGEDALCQFAASLPDVVILDIMMPGMDGLRVCSEMLRIAEVPIIMLTALDSDDATVEGLAAGAIDYVTKPFSIKVLLARVSAATRRSVAPLATTTAPAYNDGYLRVDVAKRKVWVCGEQVKLTRIEHQLLACLLEHPGEVIPLEEILKQVWGEGYCDSPNYVHVYISRLRDRLDPPSKEHAYLDNVRGTGYRFVPR